MNNCSLTLFGFSLYRTFLTHHNKFVYILKILFRNAFDFKSDLNPEILNILHEYRYMYYHSSNTGNAFLHNTEKIFN